MDVQYQFRFEDKRVETFNLEFCDQDLILDPATLPVVHEPWMALSCHQCEGCELEAGEGVECPVASNLGSLVDPFKQDLSYTEVEITVTMHDRQVVKQCDLQQGIRAMMGLVMATSGCPYLDKLRPMAYTHLPFATLDETFFRAVASYAVGQLIRMQQGREPEFDLAGLRAIYRDIYQVNEGFSKRLQTIGCRDANINALIGLDVLAHLGESTFDENWLEQMAPLYSSYL